MNAEVAHLILESQGNARFPLLDPTTVGRLPENRLRLDDAGCSSRHAVIRHCEGRWILEDLGSTNGTWVNGQRLEQPWALREGDCIQVGAQGLRVAGLGNHCRNCGLERQKNAVFCSGCGLPLAAPAPASTMVMPIPVMVPPPVPVPTVPTGASVSPEKQTIIQAIGSRLSSLGIPFETGTQADLLIQTVFLDAAWGTGDKKIEYLASAFLDESDRTLYCYEFTKETRSGLSFSADSESSFQSGKTLFRKVKSVGYGPDGKPYEIDVDLGGITKAFKETAEAHCWTFKTVLKREKASYRAAALARPSRKAAPNLPQNAGGVSRGKTSILYWILFGLLAVVDALLLIAGSGLVFYVVTLAILVLLLVLRKAISKGILRPLLLFAAAGILTLVVFALAGLSANTSAAAPETSASITQKSGDVSVTLPGWTLPAGSRLAIQKDGNPPSTPGEPGIVFQAYDISLPQGTTLEGIAEIQIPFDRSLLAPGVSPEDAVGAAYYDPSRKEWEPVPCRVDAEKSQVTIYTDHFSKYAAVILKDGRKKLMDLPRFDSIPTNFYTEDDLKLIVKEQEGGATTSPTAIEKGWNQFNKMYGLTGATSTVVETTFGSETLKNLNGVMNEAGLGLAVAQLAFDIYKLDSQAAVKNFTKSGAFYAASKWGGEGLGLASAGVTFMDLALTEMGETAINANLKKWEGAYSHYYATKPGVVRDEGDWFRIVAKLHRESRNAHEFRRKMDGEVTNYCKLFWLDPDLENHLPDASGIAKAFATGGEITADPKQISDNYKAHLFKYAIRSALKQYTEQLWFRQLQKAESDFKNLQKRMNEVYTISVQLQNFQAVKNLQACSVRFITPGGQVIHSQSFDPSGQAGVKMSMFGFLKAGCPTIIEVSVPAQDDTPRLDTRLEYNLTNRNTVITVPYSPSKSKQPEPKQPERKRPEPVTPLTKPVPAPSKPSVSAPLPEKKYDYDAALAKWKADLVAQTNKSRRDETWGQDHVYTIEFTVAPHLVKDGPAPGVYGAHQIWDAWSFYTGDQKGRSGRSTVNSFAMDVSGGGMYLSLGELKGKYPQFNK